jgi:hypothetical protein
VSTFGPDLTKQERERLEVAGMTPREIDDIVSRLRIAQPAGFTVGDVLASFMANRPGG